MSDKPKYDPAAPRPDGYDEFVERQQETEVPVPVGQRAPDQVCLIALEVQFLNDEDPPEAEPGERKAYVKSIAEEIHGRLMEKQGGWQRHSISYRSLELEKADEVGMVKSAIDDADDSGIAKLPTILH